jgi:hypothetical protein
MLYDCGGTAVAASPAEMKLVAQVDGPAERTAVVASQGGRDRAFPDGELVEAQDRIQGSRQDILRFVVQLQSLPTLVTADRSPNSIPLSHILDETASD